MVAALGAAAVAAGWQDAAAQADDVIRIGIVSPNSGANARYGAFAQRGARLAADEINAAGGILGKKIQLFPGDSQCTPTEGVSATQRLIEQDKVQFIIGDVCSSVTLAMQPIVENRGVLLVNAASSNPDITYKAGVGGFKWTFRNYPTDEGRALQVLQYAVEQKKFAKFAVLSVDSDYGRGAINFTKKYLPRFKAEIVSEDYYKDKETDFRPVLTKIRRSDVHAIIMYGLADTTPIVARQMLETGMAGKVALVGNGEFTNPSTIKTAPSVFQGAVEAAAWLPEWDNPKSKAFIADYQKKYDNEVPNVHGYTHWETVRLIRAAMLKANSVKPDDVRTTLSSLTYEGVMGQVKFDDHNQGNLPMILIEIADGVPLIKGTYSSTIEYPK
ncbi:MAG: ABC transporter substrate-binding protein [Alphaproteobacteria bacterium]|nr:ABC transporter substrate-binding protein [Alphaproteobacteria bacterium]